ncbi:MAG: peptide chain release factor N(5)-glutamine methyltransferase [Chloroflexi bacterium]|jgi:release factor glutamine methyltransferase|nr:peptide chain release factor N(5)-glutamine methyltransferase [Chloroflexota bacterium]
MATIGELVRGATERLASGSETPRLDAELLLADALGIDRTSVLAHPEMPVGPDAAARYAAHLERRAAGEPVAYLRGLQEFHGLAFATDRRALVPRPETELLVDLARAELVERLTSTPRPPGAAPLAVADVGTGCGAIAVALAVALRRLGMLAEVEIVASDVSPGAVDLARENAVAHAVADRVGVTAADLLPAAGSQAGPVRVAAELDVVCANLPYVRSGDLAGLPAALSFEPRLALDGGPDGLVVVCRLLDLLPARLAPGGVALLEIGADQGEAIVAAAAGRLPGWACTVADDLGRRPRVARLEWSADRP